MKTLSTPESMRWPPKWMTQQIVILQQGDYEKNAAFSQRSRVYGRYWPRNFCKAKANRS